MKDVKTWNFLKTYTQARVGLPNSGHAIGTRENLEFQWSHAQARDAIHTEWDIEALKKDVSSMEIENFVLKTQVRDRTEYLMRPDKGRLLDLESTETLQDLSKNKFEIIFLVSNGLSSSALHAHGGNFLKIFFESFPSKNVGVFFAANARVALGDSIGEILKPKLCLTLIGERPGLSSPDSMSLYLTYEARLGRSDAERNCISNIREPHGLLYSNAIKKTLFLMEESLRKGLSGFPLKEESDPLIASSSSDSKF